jgi:hypothetical protein
VTVFDGGDSVGHLALGRRAGGPAAGLCSVMGEYECLSGGQ